MADTDCVVATFNTPADARKAFDELTAQGWTHEHLSLVTRTNDVALEDAHSLEQNDKMESSAAAGAATGAALGLLASSALLIIPGIGPVIFAGAVASGITGGLVGGLVGAMSGWGIKEDTIKKYEQEIREGKAIVLVSGNPRPLAEAQKMLQETNAVAVSIHTETDDSDRIDP